MEEEAQEQDGEVRVSSYIDDEGYAHETEVRVRMVRLETEEERRQRDEDEESENSLTTDYMEAYRLEQIENDVGIEVYIIMKVRQFRQMMEEDPADEDILMGRMLMITGAETRKEVTDYIRSLRQYTYHVKKGHEDVNCPLEESECMARWLDDCKLGTTKNAERIQDVSGDIEALKTLVGLQALSLANTLQVSGDIDALKTLGHLQWLYLENTQVSGRIDALKTLGNLQWLFLQNTQVSGDIAALKTLAHLQHLHLGNAQVTGNVDALKTLRDLQRLYLENTQVTGNIDALKTLGDLQELDLSNTSAKGNVTIAIQWKKLEKLNLRATSVSGWIDPSTWKGCCQQLRTLDLAATGSVDRCRLNASIEDLLYPLLDSSLVTVGASACGLVGDVPHLSGVAARKDGMAFSKYYGKLAQSLQVLDLSSNRLASLPAVPVATRLVLSQNEIPITVTPSALAEALRKGAEVWLEHAEVANWQELELSLPKELQLQETFGETREGFACKQLVEPLLRVTPRYTGILCSNCAEGYRATQNECKECTDARHISKRHVALAASGSAGILALGAAAWILRRQLTWDLRWQCVADLILPQLAVLLQLVQLWSVLGRLPLQDFGGAGNATGLATDFANATGGMMDSQGSQGDELLSYLQISQLTFTELQGFLALQCVFDGALVRLLFALLTPTGPLVVLLGCCVIEAFLRGIQLALKILAVLFIGGAAGVDWIGRACAASYGVVIPSFLALLFLKQYVTMRQSKTFFATSAGSQEEVTLQLHTMSSKECMKEDVKKKRLVAAAAAYVAVHAKGRAVVNLQKDLSAVILGLRLRICRVC
ncbi:Leucine-rich repeat receptor-like serine/threonine-protein kinase RGI4 (Protein RECEPTOR OF RGF1 2) (Protein RGF1 INSENSITIVE 4) (Protein STERILITY-REGULATING KINASE MEMBER 2) [Durusdinium trenchii]|uniref:Leucine-rich repeat receptor-like serine/threonine-protein kinase RGI4 (Protein RECEPTOR OF RGF1 2) (Protein RGF1 INSENSITIVE 4) (Protein STERILITY-REGULATING KINASE MEMBER 2) n=1 Tax=Durusdinium trenchii TaxID=1381693 RepID=A0ABP0I189_9DINO